MMPWVSARVAPAAAAARSRASRRRDRPPARAAPVRAATPEAAHVVDERVAARASRDAVDVGDAPPPVVREAALDLGQSRRPARRRLPATERVVADDVASRTAPRRGPDAPPRAGGTASSGSRPSSGRASTSMRSTTVAPRASSSASRPPGRVNSDSRHQRRVAPPPPGDGTDLLDEVGGVPVRAEDPRRRGRDEVVGVGDDEVLLVADVRCTLRHPGPLVRGGEHGVRIPVVVTSTGYGRLHAIRPDDPARAHVVGGRAAVARGRGPRLRPRLDVRPRDVGRPARLAVVRGRADAGRRGGGHRAHRPRHVRHLAQQPPPRPAHARGAGGRRHLGRPVPARPRQRRRPRLADHGRGPPAQGARRPLPGVHRAARPAAARGPRHRRGHLLLRRDVRTLPGPVRGGDGNRVPLIVAANGPRSSASPWSAATRG